MEGVAFDKDGNIAVQNANYGTFYFQPNFSPCRADQTNGSEMYLAETSAGVTSVYTLEDKSYVKGSADTSTLELRQGYMTTIGTSHRASTPRRFAASTLFARK